MNSMVNTISKLVAQQCGSSYPIFSLQDPTKKLIEKAKNDLQIELVIYHPFMDDTFFILP